jgi:hypothetical protein
MSSHLLSHELEPFPLFVDLAPPNSANYFSSPMAMAAIQLLATATGTSYKSQSTLPNGRPRVSVSAKVSNYLRLRYYQYEVTFGLYMLTAKEKWLFNTILAIILGAVTCAMVWGLQGFVVNLVCRLVYYLTGFVAAEGRLCS